MNKLQLQSFLTYAIQFGLGGLALLSFIGLIVNLLTHGIGNVSFGIYG